VVTGPRCGYCDADLELPWIVKRLVAQPKRSGRAWWPQAQFTLRLSGNLLFLIGSIWTIVSLGALTPNGRLHQFFLGLCLLSWVGVGRSLARTLHPGPSPVIRRFAGAVVATAAVPALVVTLVFADGAQSRQESALAALTAGERTALIGEQVLAVPTGELRVEYLQVDHELLGYHRIIPVAVSGAERVPLQHGATGWLTDRLSRYADGQPRRGWTVRRRAGLLRLVPGEAYEIIQREGEVRVRRMGST
jgi:hypothetical protein